MTMGDQGPAAFRVDRSVQAVRSAIKAVWWGAAGVAARVVARPGDAPSRFAPSAPAAPEGLVRRAWLEAFEKDAAAVGRGLYPPVRDHTGHPIGAIHAAADVLKDARAVEQRRRRKGGVEARDDTPEGGAYPNYYRQNFHFQSGGWFTPDSARRYEAQVETLFGGAAGAMRRCALALLATAWSRQDHRGSSIIDLACGSGAFLGDLSAAFPRAQLFGADLSAVYLGEAGRRSGLRTLFQANVERLPLAASSVDALTCIYLFHELPPKVRQAVAAEIARVLKPGGRLVFADSIQPSDEPRLARLLEAFPAYFHEPFYASYSQTDLVTLFGEAGLVLEAQDSAFLTKAMLFQRRQVSAEQLHLVP